MRLDPITRLKRAPLKACKQLRGIRVEVLFIKKCLRDGFDISQPEDTKVDFLVNGHLVEVKSCFTPTTSNTDPKYKYTATWKQVEEAEYFALFHWYNNSFFIIPNTIPTEEKKGCYSIIMPIHIDEDHKWFRYQNNFECLETSPTHHRPEMEVITG